MFAEDFSVFFTEFADEALINGSTDPVMGLFDNGHGEVLNDFSGTRPSFTCPESEVDTDPRDQAIVIKGVNYTILDFEADGTGVIVLALEKA